MADAPDTEQQAVVSDSKEVLSVSQLNNRIASVVQDTPVLNGVCCIGEVTDLHQNSTVLYFTLTDDDALVPVSSASGESSRRPLVPCSNACELRARRVHAGVEPKRPYCHNQGLVCSWHRFDGRSLLPKLWRTVVSRESVMGRCRRGSVSELSVMTCYPCVVMPLFRCVEDGHRTVVD
jgi:hypothetical protein